MNAHGTFEGLERLSRDAINGLAPQEAPASLIRTLDRQGWCVMRDAAESLQGFKQFVSSLNVPIAEKYGDLPRSGAADVFRTISVSETEIAVEPGADIVAVEQVRFDTLGVQPALQ